MESLRNRELEEKKCILSRPVSPGEITNFPWGNKGKTYLMFLFYWTGGVHCFCGPTSGWETNA